MNGRSLLRNMTTEFTRLQVLAEVVQTGPHAAVELQYACHDGSAASIPLEFAAAETSQGDALAVLHAMWWAPLARCPMLSAHMGSFAFYHTSACSHVPFTAGTMQPAGSVSFLVLLACAELM